MTCKIMDTEILEKITTYCLPTFSFVCLVSFSSGDKQCTNCFHVVCNRFGLCKGLSCLPCPIFLCIWRSVVSNCFHIFGHVQGLGSLQRYFLSNLWFLPTFSSVCLVSSHSEDERCTVSIFSGCVQGLGSLICPISDQSFLSALSHLPQWCCLTSFFPLPASFSLPLDLNRVPTVSIFCGRVQGLGFCKDLLSCQICDVQCPLYPLSASPPLLEPVL